MKKNKCKAFLFGNILMLWVFLLITGASLPACAGSREKLRFGFTPDLAAGRDFVPRQLIVGFMASGRSAIISEASKFGGVVSNEIDGETLLLYFPSESDTEAAARALAELQETNFIERNGIKRLPPVIERHPGHIPQ